MEVDAHQGSCCGFREITRFSGKSLKEAIDSFFAELQIRKSSCTLYKRSFVYILPEKLQTDQVLVELASMKEKSYPELNAVQIGDAIFFTFFKGPAKQTYDSGRQSYCFPVYTRAAEATGYQLLSGFVDLPEKLLDDKGCVIVPKLLQHGASRYGLSSVNAAEQLLDKEEKAYLVLNSIQYKHYGGFVESCGFKVAMTSINPNTASHLYLLVRGGFSAVEI